MRSVRTVAPTVAGLARAGIDGMTRFCPLTVKQPVVAPPLHGNSVTGVPACCSAVVPISIAVAPVMFEPLIVTVPPPATDPRPGELDPPPRAAGPVFPAAGGAGAWKGVAAVTPPAGVCLT